VGVEEKHEVKDDGKGEQREVIIACQLSIRISVKVEKIEIKVQLLTPQVTIIDNTIRTIKVTKVLEVNNLILQQKHLAESKKVKRYKKMSRIVSIHIN